MTEDAKGYLYCLWNPMFSSYGDDVYKLGRTSCLASRLNGYTTSYIQGSVYKYTSKRVFFNSVQAERVLFFLLRKHRMRKNREFFQTPAETVIETIKRVENLTDNQIDQLYNLIVKDLCSDRLVHEIETFEEHAANSYDLDDLDEYFSQFKYSPSAKTRKASDFLLEMSNAYQD